ncbi:uncharacterized protein LOC143001735 isoform X1 [Genypterus blacodes]|uniref:uncharacterized protein LOC143001735 isoform X1 n=1 Tax=Genypterus blacodes TaxID=154954 RepID=UPI003F75A769
MTQKEQKKMKFYTHLAGKTLGAHTPIVKELCDRGALSVESSEECDVIICFCPVASRVRMDVASAMASLSELERHRVILVVMHHTLDTSLTMTPTKVTQDQVTLVVDCLFHESKGFFSCKRNEEAVKSILEEMGLPTGILFPKVGLHIPGPSSNNNMMKFYTHLAGKTLGAHTPIVKELCDRGALSVESSEECDVIICFCPVASLVGVDVASAMASLSELERHRVILVVMHHTLDTSLTMRPTKVTQDQVTLVVDCLFHESKGFFSCKRNEEAVKSILEKMGLPTGIPKSAKKKMGLPTGILFPKVGLHIPGPSSNNNMMKFYTHLAGKTLGAHTPIVKELCDRGALSVESSEECDVIICFCPAASLVGVDVASAMASLSELERHRVILVVMHHTLDTSLTMTPTKVTQDQVTLVVDCLFHESKGFFSCKRNEEAVKSILEEMGLPTGILFPKVGLHIPGPSSNNNMMKFYTHLAGKTLGAHTPIVKELCDRGALSVESSEECDVIICFCPVASLVGVDVASAMASLSELERHRVILVVMHHTLDTSLTMRPTKVTQDQVTLVVDCLFHESKGFFSCKRNEEAVKSILEKMGLPTGIPKSAKKKNKEAVKSILEEKGQKVSGFLESALKKVGLHIPGPSSNNNMMKFYTHLAGKTLGAHTPIVKELCDRGALSVESSEECDVIICFCPVASRVRMDVASAMASLSELERRPVILVVMHHTLDTSLTMTPTKVTQDQVTLVVDCLFHESKGFFSCKRNKEAVKSILEEMGLPTGILFPKVGLHIPGPSSNNNMMKFYTHLAGKTLGAHTPIVKELCDRGALSVESSEECDVIICFCPAASLVGVDVASAMASLSELERRPVILVVMHHTLDTSLTMTATKVTQDQVTLVVDCLFHESKGFFSCKRNEEAVKSILEKMGLPTGIPKSAKKKNKEAVKSNLEEKGQKASGFLESALKKVELHIPGPSSNNNMMKFYTHLAGKTLGAHTPIVKKLCDRGALSVESSEECDVIICFCPVASRVRMDVASAMASLSELERHRVILVVMHHTLDTSLTMRPTKVTQDQVTLVVDCLFHESKGFFSCKRNKEAVKSILEEMDLPTGIPKSAKKKNKQAVKSNLEEMVQKVSRFFESKKKVRSGIPGPSSNNNMMKFYTHLAGKTLGAHTPIVKELCDRGALSVLLSEECDVIICFCPAASRVGTDVASAMASLSELERRPVILVVMHHTLDTSLTMTPTKVTQDQVTLVVDCLFHESKGFFSCKRNEEAVKSILEEMDLPTGIPKSAKKKVGSGIPGPSSNNNMMKFYTHLAGKTLGAHTPIVKELCDRGALSVESSEECDVIICFCPAASRVGTDVASAMASLSELERRPVILVVMHHTLDTSLTMTPTKVTQDQVTLVVDCLFHESKGFFSCKRNKEAGKSILEEMGLPTGMMSPPPCGLF